VILSLSEVETVKFVKGDPDREEGKQLFEYASYTFHVKITTDGRIIPKQKKEGV